MATKKQKRAIAEAKRAKMMDEYRRTGLEAQRKDREHRIVELRRSQEKGHEKHNWKKRDKDCLWCKDEIRVAKAKRAKMMDEIRVAKAKSDMLNQAKAV